MSVVRVHKQENYSAIKNETLRDASLSWEARGLLAYLLSRPDNWQISVVDLTKQSKHQGIKVIRRLLKELESRGYVERKRVTGDDGRFVWTSVVYESPSTPKGHMEPSTPKASMAEASMAEASMLEGKIQERTIDQELSNLRKNEPEEIPNPVETVSNLFGDQVPSGSDPSIPVVKRVFQYYLKIIDPVDRSFDAKAKKKGSDAFRVCLARSRDKTPESAEEVMMMCVDEMYASDFHMGRGKYEGNAYISWSKHLFKNKECIDGWLNRIKKSVAAAKKANS